MFPSMSVTVKFGAVVLGVRAKLACEREISNAKTNAQAKAAILRIPSFSPVFFNFASWARNRGYEKDFVLSLVEL